MSPRLGERGSGTVLVVLSVAALLAMTVGGLAVVQAVVASHRARVAADLGALAGATARQLGVESPCARAGSVAKVNGAHLLSCRVDGPDVEIAVTVDVSAWPLGATARSRAGPPPGWQGRGLAPP